MFMLQTKLFCQIEIFTAIREIKELETFCLWKQNKKDKKTIASGLYSYGLYFKNTSFKLARVVEKVLRARETEFGALGQEKAICFTSFRLKKQNKASKFIFNR